MRELSPLPLPMNLRSRRTQSSAWREPASNAGDSVRPSAGPVFAGQPAPRSAFTLIELLVVLAILALLVSMLLPALHKARGMARLSLCAASTRAFSLGMISYTAEHNGAWLRGIAKYNFNSSSTIGRARDFAVRFARYLGGQDINRDMDHVRQSLMLKEENWHLVANTDLFWCPSAPGPESVTRPFLPETRTQRASPHNGILGTSIVPNGLFAPVQYYDPWQQVYNPRAFELADRIDQLRGPVSRTLLCGDGTELGYRTFGSYRGRNGDNYIGEYADPMYRHLTTDQVAENLDQAWWAPPYGQGPEGGEQPRGNGLSNVGFADGHVEAYVEDDLERDWNTGHLNYNLK